MTTEATARANNPMESPTEQFSNAMQQRGLIPPSQPIADGKIHRCDVEGKNGKNDGAYLLHLDGIPSGGFENHKDGKGWENWREDLGRQFTPDEEAAHKQKVEAIRREREADIARRHIEGQAKAQAILSAAKPATGDHSYEIRKKINACSGVMLGAWTQRQKDDCLLIPIYDSDGILYNVQAIFPAKDEALGRDKDFLYGARKSGLYFPIGQLDGAVTILTGEGYATMMSCHMATGMPAAVVFDAGNIAPVVENLRKKYPNARIIIAADDDRWKPEAGNPGKEKAEEAAKRFGCQVVFPTFRDTSTWPTDWNDLAVLEGLEAIKNQLTVTVSHKVLVALTLHDFLTREIPPREMILEPVIPTQGLIMLYALRGIGKTYVSLSIALAVATGSAILGKRWKAEKSRHVLFVDGEMPAVVLQERLASLSLGLGKELPAPDYLKIITPDMQEQGIPDLATPEGQQAIEQHLEGVELLILDNLSSLLRQGKENEAESWMTIQSWLLSLRRRGISVALVHHANKAGGQRGTSKKEDLLDTVVVLKRPENYDPTHGAQFQVHYEKTRGFHGDAAKPFEARLSEDEKSLKWEVMDVEDSMAEQARALKAEGLSQRDIAKELNTSAASINRLLKKKPKEGKKP